VSTQPGIGIEAYGRWGTPAQGGALRDSARTLLDELVGRPQARPQRPLDQVTVAPSRLSEADLTALTGIVGTDGVDVGRDVRLIAAGGSSYAELLRLRNEAVPAAPDVVVAPASHDEVAAVLSYCSDHRLAVVPFGGGTSVVGGVDPDKGSFTTLVSLSLHRMIGIVSVDKISHLATFLPGTTGPQVERELAEHGLTLGHLPQSWERATVGGWLATRSAGQNSSGYGRSDEMVERITMATPTGTVHAGHVPDSAAGPDLKELIIGSEGVFGVITEATLRVRDLPQNGIYEGYVFPSWDAGVNVFRELAQLGIKPDIMRLSDPDESLANLVMGTSENTFKMVDRYLNFRGIRGGALAILGWEGASDVIDARRALAVSRLKRVRAVKLGSKVGEGWKHGRFAAPYLRDTLLDEGYLVETLETATSWDKLTTLRIAVVDALKTSLADDGPGPMVMSHVSHVYETGASLYVTVIGRGDQADAADRWWAAKRSAMDTIVAQGATITHHHAVGRDHAPWYAAEVGEAGVEIVRALKAHFDPNGVMNPGALIGSMPA
jgi:alkyldihydroxyacetonephosphate synthase